jgi:hypothetical protein
MNSTDPANTTGARPRWLWRLVRPILRRRRFSRTGFHAGMRARYDFDGATYNVIAVNFPERLLGLRAEHDDPDDVFYVRAENADILA